MGKKRFKKFTLIGLLTICLLFLVGIVSVPESLIAGVMFLPFLFGTTLAVDTYRVKVVGDVNEIPVIASDIIYEGAAVGIVKASGHARPLTSADKFAGFAEQKADNSAGSAAAINVRVVTRGVVKLSVSGAVITDVGQPVYATDDNAFVFSPVSAVYIGKVIRFVSSGVVEVQFDAIDGVDPYGDRVRETVSADLTLDAEDSGKLLWVDTDAKVITLPAVAGLAGITVVNGGAYGTILVTIDPNAVDMIEGPNITAADNKDILNTKATANRGDLITLEYGDANGWAITAIKGTWVREA